MGQFLPPVRLNTASTACVPNTILGPPVASPADPASGKDLLPILNAGRLVILGGGLSRARQMCQSSRRRARLSSLRLSMLRYSVHGEHVVHGARRQGRVPRIHTYRSVLGRIRALPAGLLHSPPSSRPAVTSPARSGAMTTNTRGPQVAPTPAPSTARPVNTGPDQLDVVTGMCSSSPGKAGRRVGIKACAAISVPPARSLDEPRSHDDGLRNRLRSRRDLRENRGPGGRRRYGPNSLGEPRVRRRHAGPSRRSCRLGSQRLRGRIDHAYADTGTPDGGRLSTLPCPAGIVSHAPHGCPKWSGTYWRPEPRTGRWLCGSGPRWTRAIRPGRSRARATKRQRRPRAWPLPRRRTAPGLRWVSVMGM